MKINAAVLYESGSSLVIDELEVPTLQRGQVLVKILFSGVCRSQLMEVRGLRGVDKWLPHLMGHEASGIVVETGENVTKVKKGDRVILGWIKGAGIDAPGAKFKDSKGRIINSGGVTTFSNYSIVAENRVVKLESNIPDDVAVLFGCALPTGAGIVYNELLPKSHERFAIIGLGGIGLSALMALKEVNPEILIAIDVSEEKLETAKQFGATHTINAKLNDVKAQLEKILPEGVDGCVESGGRISTIELGFSLLKKGGRLFFASHPPEGQQISIDPFELISGKKIFGSWGGGCNPDIDIPRLIKNYDVGVFPLEKLIRKRYKLNQINDALNDLENNLVFRPVIEMEHE
jgi:S-(hydroxymethyl)glutathione dehydrogenase/alcohol dehydrogenase